MSDELVLVPEWVPITDNIAGKIFFAGFIINRIKDIPMGPVSFVLAAISISSYFLAYSLQILTSCYYDKSPTDFFDYQFLFQLQSICGAAASLMVILNPELWLACLWVFVITNIFWYLAEIYRQNHPTQYPSMPSQPKHYLEYTLWLTIAITCSAIMGAIAAYFPLVSVQMMAIGMILNYLATIFAFIANAQPDEPQETQLKFA
jgi:hypothetical protein